jgi:hypothetical protein
MLCSLGQLHCLMFVKSLRNKLIRVLTLYRVMAILRSPTINKSGMTGHSPIVPLLHNPIKHLLAALTFLFHLSNLQEKAILFPKYSDGLLSVGHTGFIENLAMAFL